MGGIRFQSLAIRRMPGIRDSGFELTDLAPGVNVVFGPNASGKTTTARALETLLWPARSPDGSVWISATFELDGSRWSAEVDAGRARLQRNGEPTGAPHALPVEASSRYRLELKDLLEAEDRGLARAIGLESAGGYDLIEAARPLSPRRTPSRPNSAMAELRAARDRLAAARAVQDELQLETATLRADEGRLETMPAAEARLDLLRLALDHARRVRELEEARERMASYHPAVALLVGDEDRRCSELRARLEKAVERARFATEGVARAGAELERLALPAALLTGDRLSTLAAIVEELDLVESEIRVEQRAMDEAALGLETESEHLDPLDRSELAGVTLADVNTLIGSAREVEESRARRNALEEEIALLEDVGVPDDRARLERGAFLLQQWLRSPDPLERDAGPPRWVAVAGSIILLVVGAGLAILHPSALLLSAAGAFLLSVTLKRRELPNSRKLFEQKYMASGLEGPATWIADEVQSALDDLTERIIRARMSEEVERRRQRLGTQLEDVRQREGELLERFTESTSAIGLGSVEAGALAWVFERVSRWQNASAALEGARVRLGRTVSQRGDGIERANRLLVEMGLPQAADSSALRGAIQTLSERALAHEKANAELEKWEADLASAEARSAELKGELARLFERLSVEESEADLADWCGQREAFLASRRQLDSLETETARLEMRLRTLPDFDPSIVAQQPAEIERESIEQSATLDELRALQLRVMELRTRVAQAMRGHDIENALAEVDRCETALRKIRERDSRSAIAAVLVDHVERAARNDQRPEVFHRASALFTRITRGRYELMLDDRDEPGFRAFDTHHDQSQTLDQLSSATRLQLLLAVRVAFVEVQEGGVQLPVFMDETLANSDDERAGAIIDAVIALASAGRQIFYFTAQPDEVRQWRGALEKASVEGRVIDLAEIRRMERKLDPAELERVTEPLPEPPAPEGRSHAQYGELLGVPAVDALEPVGALHLWYLIEEPERLHGVMTATRAERWGSLRALLESGGSRLIPEDVARHVEALAAAAHAALLRVRIGRGRPVDRHALAVSGAVSGRFIEEVAELLESVGGDGLLLLNALERRAVPKFFQKNIQSLREFLEEAGYVDTRPPVSPSIVRFEVLTDSARAIDDGVMSVAEVERLLGRLGVAPGWNEPIVEAEINPSRLQTALDFGW